MTRVIHTGDTHLGYEQYHLPARREDFLEAFRRVVDDAVTENVDAVIHAGDLFHDRQPRLDDIMGALSILSVLDDADIPFLAVVGNHEKKRDGQWLDLFESFGLATRLGRSPVTVGDGDVAFYGLDFVARSQRESLSYEFESTQCSQSVLVSHGLFEPFEFGDWDAREILRQSPVAFDAFLLGDDHTPATKRIETPHEAWLTYCGSTERTSASEREERGYNLVSFDGDVDIRRRGIDTRAFVFVDGTLEEGEGSERVRERISQYDVTDAVVIVTLTGTGEEVMPAEIESYAESCGALVSRLNDRREATEEDELEVDFADPDSAVEDSLADLGLSSAARHIDETIRASTVADSNVATSVESYVESLVDDDELGALDPASRDSDTAGSRNQEAASPENESDGADCGGEESPAAEHQSDASAEREPAEGDSTESGEDQSQVTMEDYL